MSNNSHVSSLVEVANSEKQLWELIHSKGLLHLGVQVLYRQICHGYENIILSDQEGVELLDIEYDLWKVHYRHIYEFRKMVGKSSANSEGKRPPTRENVYELTERFKLFLSEATEFYQGLITRLKALYGLEGYSLPKETCGISCSVEPTKMHNCLYLCHRLFICLGDLARYKAMKPDLQSYYWSVSASHYFESTRFWHDSGNPHNQLALLATYIGDDFLALYHCVRSIAVKEPFPDAGNNLILPFETNRSSHLHFLCKEAHFNFLAPSERCALLTVSQSSNGGLNSNESEAAEDLSSSKRDLWPLFVRTMSFFFMQSSRLEDFPWTFASTMRELEAMLALNDIKLKALLESYQYMGEERTGPYRPLQIVSVLIFVVNSLIARAEQEESKDGKKTEQPTLTELSLTVTFVVMGRLTERCLEGNSLKQSPLLPAILVQVEWLTFMLDKVETYIRHERVQRAISYFFDAFVELLNRLDCKESEGGSENPNALWEDYELRGFSPMAQAHDRLDFAAQRRPTVNAYSGNESRAYRIILAAERIADRSGSSQLRWISYDKTRREFYKEMTDDQHRRVEICKPGSDPKAKTTLRQHRDQPSENTKPVAAEEEEVILFKPIMRFNSAPPFSLSKDDTTSSESTKDQTESSDECLRRAASLCHEPSPAQFDSSGPRNGKPLKQQEVVLKNTATYPAGPPSLSAWVVNNGSLNTEKEKESWEFYKPGLSTIEEIASTNLPGLSISGTRDSLYGPGQAPTHPAPLPSAPLLPDDAIWFAGNPSNIISNPKSLGFVKETDGILGPSPLISHTNRPVAAHVPCGIPTLIDSYQPVLGLSSSEWQKQCRSRQNLGQESNLIWPIHHYTPDLAEIYCHDGSKFVFYDGWGNPLSPPSQMVYLGRPQNPGSLIYGADEQRRGKPFHGYQGPSPYGCGAVMAGLRAEQPPLFQYLKEKEWQLQRQPHVKAPPFMGN